MAKVTGTIASYPARASFGWYCGLIVVGCALLSLPAARAPTANRLSLVDAAFTSTSAACVTGLTVRSTGDDLSPIGQLIILVLIQLGGIGIMTFTTFFTFRLGGRKSLRQRAVVSETLGAGEQTDLVWVLRNVIVFSLLLEGVGFLVLALRNLFEYPIGEALWNALFHSVSAFCNAGFSLHDDSLTRYQGDIVVNATVASLVVIGGVGFPVILDLRRSWRDDEQTWGEYWSRLHLHSKVMLLGTLGLLSFGMLIFLLLEWDGVLKDMSVGRRLMVSAFQSVTCRTAGFNTVRIGSLTNATLFIMVLLMMVGAGPCSTGGGFKVSTFMTLVMRAWATFHGYHRVSLFRRTIPATVVERATAGALLFAVVGTIALTGLLVIEQSLHPHSLAQGRFMDAAFEVISALGTVGLSTGLTVELNSLSKIVIMLLMFMGRLGPITVFIALSRSERDQRIEFPQEEPLIG